LLIFCIAALIFFSVKLRIDVPNLFNPLLNAVPSCTKAMLQASLSKLNETPKILWLLSPFVQKQNPQGSLTLAVVNPPFSPP